MKGIGWLAASALAFAGAMVVQATPPGTVNEAAILDGGMPRTLSEFGFFVDAGRQVPVKGVTPYRLNTPLYSDGAEKLRFVFVPTGSGAAGFAVDDGLLEFPVGSALIKTFAFSDGATRRLIETRVLLHRAEGWVALPYLWNQAQTEATLAIAGARVDATTPRGERISYRVPNKNQCKDCHGLEGAVTPIGPKARNLSREWLAAMTQAGRLEVAPDGADRFPLWEQHDRAAVQDAARAYLDVNCAHCHRPGGTASNSGLDLRWEQDEPHALGIGKRPVAAGRGAGHLQFDIVPGAPGESILVHRMASEDPGVAMPELGKSTIDVDGLALVRRWIEQMAPAEVSAKP